MTDFEVRPVAPIERALAAQTKSTADKVLIFLNDLCHPEAFGHAVTAEVRRRARELATELEAGNARI